MLIKTILREMLLSEALPISVAREYVSITRNSAIKTRLHSIFQKLMELPDATQSKRGDRVYFPFGVAPARLSTKTEVEVIIALDRAGYTLKDYIQGIVVDKNNRQMKLNKVLQRLGEDDLISKVNTDPVREGAKKKDKLLVFSRHPYDIAGMSTDRGWTSCMNIYTGGFADYVQYDVKEGSFICYLTTKEDLNVRNPSARVLIKPFVNIENSSDVLYAAEESVYGTAPGNFRKAVEEILSSVQKEKYGKFELVDTLYCDSEKTVVKHSEDVNAILSGNRTPKTESEVWAVLKALNLLKNFSNPEKIYTINADLTVDVDGNVDLSGLDLQKIPIKFGKVTGTFDVSKNFLVDLENSPKYVGGAFTCKSNSLESLRGGPYEVGESFYCSFNPLKSLKGGPDKFGTNDFGEDPVYDCTYTQLTNLEGAPRVINGSFICSNSSLNSLEGAPVEIKRDFIANNNTFTSLKGGPKIVGGWYRTQRGRLQTLHGAPTEVVNFDVSLNNLKDLEGAPRRIEGVAAFENNKLISLKGAPEYIGGNASYYNNDLTSLRDAPKYMWGNVNIQRNYNLSAEEIEWAKKHMITGNGTLFYD